MAATDVSDLLIKIDATTESLRRELKKAEDAVGNATKGIDSKVKNIDKRFEQMGATVKRVAGVMVASLAAVGVAKFGKSILDATIKQEAAVRQLQQGLITTGGVVGKSLDELIKKAGELQAASTFGDEEIIKGMSQLVSFTSIVGDQFERTTELALDLSTRFDQDLKSSFLQLGKALNDPIANLGALSRTGIQFNDGQKEIIKTLAKTNRLAEAQNLILDVMQEQFGGSARAARETLGGALKSLKNAFGDLLEGESGGEGVKGTTEAINDLTDTLNDPQVKAGFQAIVSGALKVVDALAKAAAGVVSFADAVTSIGDSGDVDDLAKQIERLEAALNGNGRAGAGRNRSSDSAIETRLEKLRTELTLAKAAQGDAQAMVAVIKMLDEQIAELEGKAGSGRNARASKTRLGELRQQSDEMRKTLLDLITVSEKKIKVDRAVTDEVVDMEAAVEALKIGTRDLKRETDAWVDSAYEGALKYRRELDALLDEIYPQQAAVRKLGQEYDLLVKAVERGDIAVSVLGDWRRNNTVVLESVQDLADEADTLAAAWERGLERIDDGFANTFKEMLRTGRVSFDALKDLALDTLGEIIYAFARNKILLGIGATGVSGSALAGAPQALGGVSGGGVGSLFGLGNLLGSTPLAGIGDVVSNLGFSTGSRTLFDIGGRLQGMSLTDIGLSAGAGLAGGWAGTTLGESLFGKQAESAWGATAGGIIGSLTPLGPLGSAIGAAIGGLLDAAFGGDGKKRAALGIRTDPNAPMLANGQQITAASGLELTSYAKRAGQEGWDAANLLLQQFAAIDAGLTGLMQSLGVDVDLSGDALTGKAHQAGKNGGNFFGSAIFNGIDQGDVEGAAAEFIRIYDIVMLMIRCRRSSYG